MGEPSEWTDLDRPPLRAAALRLALVEPAGPLSSLTLLRSCPSTNAVLRDWVNGTGDVGCGAGPDSPPGRVGDLAVLVTDHQTHGRGRLQRIWSTPARSSLTFSLLLRGGPPADRWGWAPLLAGSSVVRVLREVAGVRATLKWPNDVLIPDPQAGPAKVAGILTELVSGEVPSFIIGIGLNVSQQRDELPGREGSPVGDGGVPALPATSLRLAGASCTDRDPLLRALLRRLADTFAGWRAGAGDLSRPAMLQEQISQICDTVGRDVRALQADGSTVTGRATGIGELGQLLVSSDCVTHVVTAADVIHLRAEVVRD